MLAKSAMLLTPEVANAQPIVVTLSPSTISPSEEQPKNVAFFVFAAEVEVQVKPVKLSWKFTVASAVQFANTLLPNVNTLDGMVMLVSAVQFSNALTPIGESVVP